MNLTLLRGAASLRMGVILALVTIILSGCDELETPVHVAYALDVSGTFFTKDSPYTLADKSALKELGYVIADQARDWMPPIEFHWGLIASFNRGGGTAETICRDVRFQPSLVKREYDDVTRLGSIEELKEWHIDCLGRMNVAVIQPDTVVGTNISGAIRNIVETTSELGGPKPKLLILFSDFNEEPPPGSGEVSFDFDLSQHYVFMLHRPGFNEEDEEAYLERVDQWETRLVGAGALDVCRMPLEVFSVTAAEQCLERIDNNEQ